MSGSYQINHSLIKKLIDQKRDTKKTLGNNSKNNFGANIIAPHTKEMYPWYSRRQGHKRGLSASGIEIITLHCEQKDSPYPKKEADAFWMLAEYFQISIYDLTVGDEDKRKDECESIYDIGFELLKSVSEPVAKIYKNYNPTYAKRPTAKAKSLLPKMRESKSPQKCNQTSFGINLSDTEYKKGLSPLSKIHGTDMVVINNEVYIKAIESMEFGYSKNEAMKRDIIECYPQQNQFFEILSFHDIEIGLISNLYDKIKIGEKVTVELNTLISISTFLQVRPSTLIESSCSFYEELLSAEEKAAKSLK